MKSNPILEKSYEFALNSISIYKDLIEKKEFVLSKQYLKSSTSIGANIEEAIGGISKRDFRAKMSIAYKEARETKYWLRLLRDSGYLHEKTYASALIEIEEILKLLYRIIQSAK